MLAARVMNLICEFPSGNQVDGLPLVVNTGASVIGRLVGPYLKLAVNRQPGYRWDNSQIKSTTQSAEVDHGHDGKQLFLRGHNLWEYGSNMSFRGAL